MRLSRHRGQDLHRRLVELAAERDNAFSRDLCSRARHTYRSKDLAAGLADRRADAAKANFVLLVVEGVAALRRQLEIVEQAFDEQIVFSLCRGMPCSLMIPRTVSSGRYASMALPRPVQCTSIRLPIQVASRGAPVGSYFATSTASPRSRIAMWTVKCVRSASPNSRGAACSRSVRPMMEELARLNSPRAEHVASGPRVAMNVTAAL